MVRGQRQIPPLWTCTRKFHSEREKWHEPGHANAFNGVCVRARKRSNQTLFSIVRVETARLLVVLANLGFASGQSNKPVTMGREVWNPMGLWGVKRQWSLHDALQKFTRRSAGRTCMEPYIVGCKWHRLSRVFKMHCSLKTTISRPSASARQAQKMAMLPWKMRGESTRCGVGSRAGCVRKRLSKTTRRTAHGPKDFRRYAFVCVCVGV